MANNKMSNTKLRGLIRKYLQDNNIPVINKNINTLVSMFNKGTFKLNEKFEISKFDGKLILSGQADENIINTNSDNKSVESDKKTVQKDEQKTEDENIVTENEKKEEKYILEGLDLNSIKEFKIPEINLTEKYNKSITEKIKEIDRKKQKALKEVIDDNNKETKDAKDKFENKFAEIEKIYNTFKEKKDKIVDELENDEIDISLEKEYRKIAKKIHKRLIELTNDQKVTQTINEQIEKDLKAKHEASEKNVEHAYKTVSIQEAAEIKEKQYREELEFKLSQINKLMGAPLANIDKLNKEIASEEERCRNIQKNIDDEQTSEIIAESKKAGNTLLNKGYMVATEKQAEILKKTYEEFLEKGIGMIPVELVRELKTATVKEQIEVLARRKSNEKLEMLKEEYTANITPINEALDLEKQKVEALNDKKKKAIDEYNSKVGKINEQLMQKSSEGFEVKELELIKYEDVISDQNSKNEVVEIKKPINESKSTVNKKDQKLEAEIDMLLNKKSNISNNVDEKNDDKDNEQKKEEISVKKVGFFKRIFNKISENKRKKDRENMLKDLKASEELSSAFEENHSKMMNELKNSTYSTEQAGMNTAASEKKEMNVKSKEDNILK